ncbi:hypothetical protein V5O48_010507 [Marasmius crinis-equi]|uniref:Uncharacterized protein n=1 Tax=Marasmius crinis-equi TaxID=585013 RepID=A0ABR3F879_9AGAR
MEAIINFDKSSLTMRNIKGSLPLHITGLHSYPEITKLLLEASHTEDAPELRKMVASLLEEKNSQLEKELSAFARYIETHLASAKSEYKAKEKHDEEKSRREERNREEEQKWAGEGRWYKGVITWDSNDPP